MKDVKVQLGDGQYAALVDFVFNVGSDNFESSTLLKVVNANNESQVPLQLRRWIYANGKPFAGLVKRRNAEVALYTGSSSNTRAVPASGDNLSSLDIVTGRAVPFRAGGRSR
jgi:GH24 family phage-related lysozyme (muramidase)